MSHDIVTRLRISAEEIINGRDIEVIPGTYLVEAADEIERLRKAYKDLFQIANHAYCYNNFKVLQDNMQENQKTASELGLYP